MQWPALASALCTSGWALHSCLFFHQDRCFHLILFIIDLVYVLYYPGVYFIQLILQYCWVRGSAWHSHPTAVCVLSSFLGNPWKTSFIYILDLGSAQFGNLKDWRWDPGPILPSKDQNFHSRSNILLLFGFFFLEIADCSQGYQQRQNKRKGNKEDGKQNPFLEAFWYGLGVCFQRWFPSWHGLGLHKLCFFQIQLNWKMCSRATHSTLQPEMDIQSIGSHEKQSELKHPEMHAVRMSGPLYQLFCSSVPPVMLYKSNPPAPHYLPKSQFLKLHITTLTKLL